MYNRLKKYLVDWSILCKKQFGFQEGRSTDHTILQPVDQMHNNSEWNNFTLGVFIDLYKAFHTADHNVLLKKLEVNGIVVKNFN